MKGEVFIEHKRLGNILMRNSSKVIGVVLTEKLSLNNMSVEELVEMGRSPYTGFGDGWTKMTAG